MDYVKLSEQKITGQRVVHKFGRNASVGTSFVPVAFGGVYQTPQTATALRIAAGNANDTAAGSGAREITLIGLDENGNEVTETVATAGTSASSATTATFLRLYRAYVSASGTYATAVAGSHSADIVIENSAGGTTWATIDATNFPKGQSEIGVYSVPSGKKAYIQSVYFFTDSSRTTDIICFQRHNILQSSAPYDAMRIVFLESLQGGEGAIEPRTPFGPFSGPCDVGFMAQVEASTAFVEIDFEIIVIDD